MKRECYLQRSVDHRIRYYKIQINLNLFGDWVVSRIFGSCSNQKPTRVIEQYFKRREDAFLLIKTILQEKVKKSYFFKYID